MLKYITIPNMISFSRIPLGFLAIYLFYIDLDYFALATMGLIVVTDYWDGIAARKYKQVSDFGKALDPICDKLVVLIIAGYLVIFTGFPIWYLVAILIRDSLVSFASLSLRKKTGYMPGANWEGKILINAIALFIISWSMEWELLKMLSFWVSIFYYIYSSAIYVRELGKQLKSVSR